MTENTNDKRGSLQIAGLGPGSMEKMTLEVKEALSQCDCVVGYQVYIDLIKEYFANKEFYSTPMRREEERCRLALEIACQGKNVVFICSGDAGVYGMAGLCYEIASEVKEFSQVKISLLPGITAALSGAALLGAPLIHDFALISLSDLMTPWEKIQKRLELASQADFCLVLYNPMSHKRKDYLFKACQILLKNLPPDRLCGWAQNIGRPGENYQICSLEELQNARLDMFTTVFIGNSSTKIVESPSGKKLVTPRGYSYEGGKSE